MDIRRLSIWKGRSATYMSNDLISLVIEDGGENLIELAAPSENGVMINALSLPYFRSTGINVDSDDNAPWWQHKEILYRAGGGYFTFPFATSSGKTNATDSSWRLERYGIDSEEKSVWKISTLSERDFIVNKVDILIPESPVLYTLFVIENNTSDDLNALAAWHSMLSFPSLSPGAMIQSNATGWKSFALKGREMGKGRLKAGTVFNDLRKVPLENGENADISVVPHPTGTYDYLLGECSEVDNYSWLSVNNPSCRSLYFMLTPSSGLSEKRTNFSNLDITQNYFGRIDAPWALFDGAASEVMALTLGFNTGVANESNLFIPPKRKVSLYVANSFFFYDNPRIAQGFHSIEVSPDSVTFKRTKSAVSIKFDTGFLKIKKIAKRLLSDV